MGCEHLILLIIQIIAVCIDICGVASTIWTLASGAVWNIWLLCLYVLLFCLLQIFVEVFFPERATTYVGLFLRYWGLGLLYVLSGIILVAIGAPPDNNNRGAAVMNFIVGLFMFSIGLLYVCLSIFSGCRCGPTPLCARCGHGSKADDYREYKG